MKLSILLTINAALAIALGIAFSLYAPVMMAFFGIAEIPEGNVLLYWNIASFARLFGAAFFGFGLVLWSIRHIPDQNEFKVETQRGIVFALLIANGIALFVAATQQFSVWNNAAGLASIVVFVLFFSAYAIFFVRGQVKP
jgi:hypothetical protein